jgi:hypothetical protein
MMKGKIAFLVIALVLLVVQPGLAQDDTSVKEGTPVTGAATGVANPPMIDVATEVANLLRSEEVTGFTEGVRTGLATGVANVSVALQSRAYDQAIAYSNELIDTVDALMKDPALAPLRSTGFGDAFFKFARSLPDMIFTSLKDPLEFGVVESLISVAVLFNSLIASMISMNFLAAIFSLMESSPDLVARLPLLLTPVYKLPFELVPVLIESVLPIVLTSGFVVFFDLTNIVGQLLSLDEGTWFSVITTPFNACMDILYVWQDTMFYIMRGTLSALASGISLCVSSPRVLIGNPIALCMASIPISIDLCMNCFQYGLVGIPLSIGISFLIGCANFVALCVAGTGLNPVSLGFSFAEGGVNIFFDWVITILDLFDLKSLRNCAGVTSEGIANLL